MNINTTKPLIKLKRNINLEQYIRSFNHIKQLIKLILHTIFHTINHINVLFIITTNYNSFKTISKNNPFFKTEHTISIYHIYTQNLINQITSSFDTTVGFYWFITQRNFKNLSKNPNQDPCNSN